MAKKKRIGWLKYPLRHRIYRVAGLGTPENRHECRICGLTIHVGERYFDGGWNMRAHQRCVDHDISQRILRARKSEIAEAQADTRQERWFAVTWEIRQGDALEVLRTLPRESVQCIVTSPPYWGLRDYGVDGQIGMEPTPEEFIARLIAVFHEAREVLRPDGVAWVNMGDCYATGAGKVGDCPGGGDQGDRWKHKGEMTARNRMPIPGLKPKDLVGQPWRLAFALQADGWYLRADCIWHKPNPMPESVTDRPTKAHEYVFLLSRSERYFYDADAVREPALVGDRQHRADRSPSPSHTPGKSPHAGIRSRPWNQETRNLRSVWSIRPEPFPDAHFATFPKKLAERCILSGSRPGDLVLDPFSGAGTTGLVALRHGRKFVGVELKPEYVALARRRIVEDAPLLNAMS